MKIFVEVASGDTAWKCKGEEGKGLIAPNENRYSHKLGCVSEGDLVLTYLTRVLTATKEWRSAIVGCSICDCKMYESGMFLVIELIKPIQFPSPIRRNEIFEMSHASPNLIKLKIINFQTYLTEITVNDLLGLLKINDENFLSFIEWANRNGIDTGLFDGNCAVNNETPWMLMI